MTTETPALTSDDLKAALDFALALGWKPASEIPETTFDSEEPTLIIRRRTR